MGGRCATSRGIGRDFLRGGGQAWSWIVGSESQRIEGVILHNEGPGSCPSHAGASPMT